MTIRRILIALCASTLTIAGVAGADGAALQGSVGPGFSISVNDASGSPVTHLDPGTYTLVADDKSNEHNFHLRGAGGVDVSTTVDEVGTKTFTVKLVDGTYNFICDVHASLMGGQFTVGTAPPVTTPKPPAPTPPRKLVLTLSSKSVTLTTPAGMSVKGLSSGAAVITVRDRLASAGIRLRGTGVSKSTSAPFVGTVTWKVTLGSGTLVYGSTGRTPPLTGRVKVA